MQTMLKLGLVVECYDGSGLPALVTVVAFNTTTTKLERHRLRYHSDGIEKWRNLTTESPADHQRTTSLERDPDEDHEDHQEHEEHEERKEHQ